jgi:hypothetical protein
VRRKTKNKHKHKHKRVNVLKLCCYWRHHKEPIGKLCSFVTRNKIKVYVYIYICTICAKIIIFYVNAIGSYNYYFFKQLMAFYSCHKRLVPLCALQLLIAFSPVFHSKVPKRWLLPKQVTAEYSPDGACRMHAQCCCFTVLSIAKLCSVVWNGMKRNYLQVLKKTT